MITFPNCKINLGLWVTDKLENAYHQIQTLMYPIAWNDVLEIVPSKQFGIQVTGKSLDANHDDNLCYRAWKLLQNQYHIPAVNIHLHKVIPWGAGLGGGSSDAAFTLSMLNSIFNLNIGSSELVTLASQLGADCPFFIYNKPMLATYTGTKLSEVELNLNGYFILIVKPNISVSTSMAYKAITPVKRDHSIAEIFTQSVDTWHNLLENDFEKPIFNQFPILQSIKNELYQQGAIYASMSGSGSAIYGLFEYEPCISGLEGYEVFIASLGSNF